ncbi:MAG: DUF4383 domain-containing protein [Patescibacteria group bacterium]
MTKTLATWLGVIFLLMGVLGFIPGITNDGMLFGVFMVDTIHSIVFLLTGILALWMGMAGDASAKSFFKIFGVIYAIIAIFGFFQGDSDKVLGLFNNNMADTWLHIVAALVFLWAGFSGGSSDAMPSNDAMPPTQTPTM